MGQVDTFAWGVSEQAQVTFCPLCACGPLRTVTLPQVSVVDGKHYLISTDSEQCSGPYSSTDEAQEHIWEFNEETNAEEGQDRAEKEEGLRLVAVDGRPVKGTRKS